MRIRSVARVALYGVLALAIVGVGCKKPITATPAAPAPPPPPPPQPTVTLQATPANVQRGQSTTLRWSSTNATSLTLAPGVGNVSPEGNTSVTPTDSQTYTITAMGPGGSVTANARVTVTVPPPPPPAPVAAGPSMEELFARDVKDAYFDFDKADIRPDARSALTETAGFLKSYTQVKVMLEGHCDERGSTEYNLALGDRRAQAAKDFLVSLGVASDRMQTVSYGKERPFCNEHTEECMQQNRRAHFVMVK
jgi:peptidoglycan-associated lipoprotein